MRKVLIVLFGLMGLTVSIQIANARSCTDVYLECYQRIGNSYSLTDPRAAKQRVYCEKNNKTCLKDGSWNGSEKGKYEQRANPNGEAERRAWEANGKKQTAVAITGPTGTQTVYFKVGVEPEGQYAGVKVLGPDGHHYQPWDPKLNALLVAGGYVTDKGVAQGYMNPKAMENQIALKRDQVVRDAAIAAGKAAPQPTGHVNNDALGNKAPKVNDHRNDKPKTSSTSSTLNTPPPAAAAGTASTTTATNPAVQDGAVRDHRKDGNAAGKVGGVTATGSGVTGVSRGGGASGGNGPGAGTRSQQ